jgi:DNA end-binding protein Ku
MRPIWKGALTFGLVNIPVGLYSATTRSDISFRLLEQSYYLEPQKTGIKAYAQPAGEALTLTTMRFAHEIVPPSGLTLPGDAGLDRREIDLALQLVDTLAGEFDAEKYRDQYREALLGVIEQKLQGRTPATPATRKPPTKVVDLIQAAARKATSRRRAS